MRKGIAIWAVSASLLFQLPGMGNSYAATLPIFDPTSTSTKGIYFDGGDSSNVQLAANTKFDIGGGDFTIDWWQKASPTQLKYPRLFQFGEGALNSDGFAVSEEDGHLYFWLDNRPVGSRGASRANVVLPDSPSGWNHFAIVRSGFILIIFVNGLEEARFDASYVDIENSHQSIYDMLVPADNGTQPLIIGGSNSSSLGGFKGEVTGFEILKGAKWETNFTPPVEYTTEQCQRRDASNVCELEALLLLYPTEDFISAPNGLTNKVDDVELSVNPGVSYGASAPSSNTDGETVPQQYTHVSLIKSANGYVSLDHYDGSTQDTLNWTQQVTILRDSSPYIYIYPNDGFEFASVTISLLDSNFTYIDGTSVTSNSSSSSFAVEDLNQEVFWFTWDDGYLKIPPNFTNFEAEITFQPILNHITLLPSENGRVCVENLGLENPPCSSSSQSVVNFDPVYVSPVVRFSEDLHFELHSVTVQIGTGESVSATSRIDTFTVLDSTSSPWVFAWEYGELVPPDGLQNFNISATFTPLPPNIQGASFASGNITFHAESPFVINSNDPTVENDYSEIENIVLEVQYFGQDPQNPSNTNAKLSCRALVEDWEVVDDPIYGDGGNIEVWLPLLQSFTVNCPGYKQTNDKTIGKLLFFEYIEGFDYQTVSRNLKVHDVDIQIDSPPGIRSNLTTGDTTFGDDIALEISHLANSDSVYYQIFSNRFSTGFCTQNINLRDTNQVLLPEKFDEHGNLLFHIPSIDQINTSCSQSFIDGQSAVENSLAYMIKIFLVDISYNFESYIDLDLAGGPNSIDNSPPAPQITPTVILPTVEESTASDKEELKQPLIESPVKQANKLPVANSSWCTKKGIWIYTVSGKLRVCDPTQKVAVQMKACSGKAATPTYPWIFKPQRFIPGATPTKSGKVLMNAVFFYKGLAISGSEKVSDKPCSNGSVFIPVEYSKMVFNFAKSERPLIWVKAS